MTRLSLRCSGGFAGVAGAQSRTLDLARVSPSEAHGLLQLLAACDFFSLPATLTKPAPLSYDLLYVLTVDQGQHHHCVHYHLDAAPSALQLLTQQLNAIAPD